MSPIRSLRAGLRALFHGREVDRELDDELRDFVERATADKIRNGMTPEAAARAARMEVGGTATKERVRTDGWESHIESAIQDLRYALRGLRRNPAFAVVAIITLALGIGANTTMFSVVNAVMLRPLPWRDADDLALIWTDDAKRGLHREATAWSTVMDWRSSNQTFSDIAYFSTQRVALTARDPVAGRGRSRSAFVSANLFGVLGVNAAIGRTISAYDDSTSAKVAVISHSLWQRWYKGDSAILGQDLLTDDPSKMGFGTLTIVGVMPEGFYFPDQLTEIWTPSTTYWRFARESSMRHEQPARRWTAVGRLKPDASFAEARADFDRIGQRLAAVHPTSVEDFPGFSTTVLPILDSIAGQNVQTALWVLLGAVSLVLLVACVNVANLLLARGAARQQEFSVRRALGAGRFRLARQLVAECMVLAILGGAVGVVVAAWATQALGMAASAYVPRINEIAIDWRVLSFALLASIVAGLVFGIAPAMRLSAADASEALKEGGRGTGRIQLRRSRDLLVVAECAIAIVLLTGAGLLLRSLDRLQSVDPGFDPTNVLAVRIEYPSARGLGPGNAAARASAGAHVAISTELVERVKSLPGVTAAGFSDDLFIGGQGNKSISIPGRTVEEMGSGELTDGLATPGFFTTLRVPLRSGRYPTADDAAQRIRALWPETVTIGMSLADKERLAIAEPVVVNEAFVRRFFPKENPVGKKFCIDPTNKTYWFEIVGVVGDMRRQGLERQAIPQWFGPFIPGSNTRADLLVRTAADPLLLAPTIWREIARILPGSTVVTVSTVDEQLGGFSSLRRLQTWLLTAFAGLAMALAAVGIFGLVHYTVTERTREIGVRVALGASRGSVMGLVLAQGMRTPLIGIVIGLVASAGLTRVIASLLFGVAPTDVMTFALVGLSLAAVAAVACFIAARRAVRIDPVLALRSA